MIAALIDLLRAKQLRVATAESCTGGMLAASLTSIAGSSDVFDRGFVTYANEAKTELLGVPADLIARAGAVSQEVAAHMAEGALAQSHADLAVSITGIAGPGGGSAEKPVGTVWFGVATRGNRPATHHRIFAGDRASVRSQARDFALALLESSAREVDIRPQ